MERQVNTWDRKTLDDLYDGVGSLAYDPLLLVKMVLYQYLKGRRSPAKWFEEAKLNEAMQWLGRGYTPARRTWYDFRDRVGGAVDKLHEQLIKNAIEQNLLDPAVGVQDGTSVAACASRHQMLNSETLNRRKELLTNVIKGAHPSSEPLPRWVPPTDTGREDLAERMRLAAKILDERIAKNAAKQAGKRKNPSKILVSLTDPIAPFGRDKMKVFRPLYTIQYVIEPISRFIMSYRCDAAATDSGTLIPMVEKIQKIVAGRLKTMMADSAYCSILDLRGCEDRGIELLAPVQANSFTEKKNRRRQTDKFLATNSVSTPSGIVISVLPVTNCRTWAANENNVIVTSHFGSLDTAASRFTVRAVHWRRSAFDLVHRVERSNVSKDRSCWMLSVPG